MNILFKYTDLKKKQSLVSSSRAHTMLSRIRSNKTVQKEEKQNEISVESQNIIIQLQLWYYFTIHCSSFFDL